MKKTEAISILATSVRPREAKDRARYDEAVKMAIEALRCSEIPNSSDSISRRAAIDALDVLCQEHRYKIPGKRETYSQYNEAWQDALDRAEGAIFNLPTVQPDHNADISKKAEGDCISRQEALKICRRYWHPTFNPIMEEIEKLPFVQPDRVIIDDCLHHIYKNISVHTATGGVIAIRYYMEKLYEEIYGEGERPWWMT